MYQILTKDEKKSCRDKYRVSKRGAKMLPRLNRLIYEGLFLIIFPIILIIASLIINEKSWWMWTLAGACFLAGITFLIGQYLVRITEYNNFLKYQNELKKKLTKRR